ncbi:MAG: redoxin domain-containing protein [Chloroflexi bacterium]|nr:redoxin domain-containing protein [Chloroflexota bacterium]
MAEVEEWFERLQEFDIKIVAGNTDGDSDTAETHANHDLSFPIAHSVPVEIAEKLGAWVGERQGKPMVQPCEFVIRPDGTVAASMYATTQLGRMKPEEIWNFVKARI